MSLLIIQYTKTTDSNKKFNNFIIASWKCYQYSSQDSQKSQGKVNWTTTRIVSLIVGWIPVVVLFPTLHLVLKEFFIHVTCIIKHAILEILITVIRVTFIDNIVCIVFFFLASLSWIIPAADTVWIIVCAIQIWAVFIVAIIIFFVIAIETFLGITVEFNSVVIALSHRAAQNSVAPVVFIVTLTSNACLVVIEPTHAFTADSPILRTRISRFPTVTASVFLSPRSARYSGKKH